LYNRRLIKLDKLWSFLKLVWLLLQRRKLMRCITSKLVKLGSVLERVIQSSEKIKLYIKNI
jgi:hypothetical protein